VKLGWRELHHEESHDLYSSDVRVIKSGRVRWKGCAARIGEERHTYFWLENVNKVIRLEDLDVDGRIILKCIKYIRV
jgi:hypothetical protein